MGTKSKVLQLLKDNSGTYLSGQEMADKIFVTRASIWKSIKSLKEEGYDIEAVTNKGYRLSPDEDKIDVSVIKAELEKSNLKIHVAYKNEVDSTNDEVRRIASAYEGEVLLIAEKQTAGRGRRGREFYSPENTGLYMSLLIRPDKSIAKLSSITGIAAVAVSKTIDEVFFSSSDATKIKWVNDIFLKDRKVSGILTEAFTSMEDEEDSVIVIGIGVNIYEPNVGFPKEIKKIAGTISKDANIVNGARNKLAACIIKNLYKYYGSEKESIEIYREKSTLIGNWIKINSFAKTDDNKKYARVTGISDTYHLQIEYENGQSDELSSGEVSVVKY